MTSSSSQHVIESSASAEAVELLAGYHEEPHRSFSLDGASRASSLSLDFLSSSAAASRPDRNMKSFYALMGVDTPFDPEHRFESSWILPPWVLFALRALISLYTFTTTFFIMGWQGTHGLQIALRRSFSYFTVLTYWGLAFYFLFAAIHTFGYARTGRPSLARWPKFLQALHSLFYTTIVTFPFLVTIVFWVVLYKGPWFTRVFNAWSNVSQHAINSGFALFELFLTRTNPPPVLHLAFLIILLALYLALAYVTYAAQGWYTYSFLDPKTGGSGRVAAYAFGILAAILVIFGIVWFLIWLRRKITESVLGLRGKLSRRSGRTADVEMSDTFGK